MGPKLGAPFLLACENPAAALWWCCCDPTVLSSPIVLSSCRPTALPLYRPAVLSSYRPAVPLSYRLAVPSPYRPTAAILLQPYGSSSRFEMAQNRRCLPTLALGRNECALHGMNAAHTIAFRAERGQYRRYCAKRKAVGAHWRTLCQTKGRRHTPTALVAFWGVGCESASFALAQRNGEESCGVLLQQGGDLADERLEAHTARLELRLLARDDHGIVREVAGERHGFAQRAARHDGG